MQYDDYYGTKIVEFGILGIIFAKYFTLIFAEHYDGRIA